MVQKTGMEITMPVLCILIVVRSSRQIRRKRNGSSSSQITLNRTEGNFSFLTEIKLLCDCISNVIILVIKITSFLKSLFTGYILHKLSVMTNMHLTYALMMGLSTVFFRWFENVKNNCKYKRNRIKYLLSDFIEVNRHD